MNLTPFDGLHHVTLGGKVVHLSNWYHESVGMSSTLCGLWGRPTESPDDLNRPVCKNCKPRRDESGRPLPIEDAYDRALREAEEGGWIDE